MSPAQPHPLAERAAKLARGIRIWESAAGETAEPESGSDYELSLRKLVDAAELLEEASTTIEETRKALQTMVALAERDLDGPVTNSDSDWGKAHEAADEAIGKLGGGK